MLARLVSSDCLVNVIRTDSRPGYFVATVVHLRTDLCVRRIIDCEGGRVLANQ